MLIWQWVVGSEQSAAAQCGKAKPYPLALLRFGLLRDRVVAALRKYSRIK
jgi:hypothetical protein